MKLFSERHNLPTRTKLSIPRRSLFSRLFTRRRGFAPKSVTITTPDYLVELDVPRNKVGDVRIINPVCVAKIYPPPGFQGCAAVWGEACLSSLPCKYKGLCADAPITEQEV